MWDFQRDLTKLKWRAIRSLCSEEKQSRANALAHLDRRPVLNLNGKKAALLCGTPPSGTPPSGTQSGPSERHVPPEALGCRHPRLRLPSLPGISRSFLRDQYSCKISDAKNGTFYSVHYSKKVLHGRVYRIVLSPARAHRFKVLSKELSKRFPNTC